MKLNMKPSRTRTIKNVLSSTVGKSADLFYGPPRQFIIFTNGRTGSNLLVSMLKKHPDITVTSEAFGEWQISDPAVRKRIHKEGAWTYFRKGMRRLGYEKIVGQKILYYHLGEKYGRAWGVPEISSIRDRILDDDDLLFIHLKRRDRLARLVSNRLANATGSWANSKYKRPVAINVTWAKRELDRMDHWERTFDELLPEGRTLRMDYEDLVSHMPGETSRVLGFLGARDLPLEPGLKRQNTKSIPEAITNYHELRRGLSGTKHEVLFRE